MYNARENFKNELKRIIGDYCPSDKCADSISYYLYAMVMKELRKEFPENDKIREESENSMEISPMMEMSFKKYLKDVVLFTSNNIVYETLKDTFCRIRNSIPLVKRDDEKIISNGRNGRSSEYISNEADFDIIDIESIPKVDISELGIVRGDETRKKVKNESNEFEGDFEMNFDEINKEIPINMKKGGVKNDELDSLNEFTTDGSIFTEGTYTGVPKITTDDLDY